MLEKTTNDHLNNIKRIYDYLNLMAGMPEFDYDHHKWSKSVGGIFAKYVSTYAEDKVYFNLEGNNINCIDAQGHKFENYHAIKPFIGYEFLDYIYGMTIRSVSELINPIREYLTEKGYALEELEFYFETKEEMNEYHAKNIQRILTYLLDFKTDHPNYVYNQSGWVDSIAGIFARYISCFVVDRGTFSIDRGSIVFKDTYGNTIKNADAFARCVGWDFLDYIYSGKITCVEELIPYIEKFLNTKGYHGRTFISKDDRDKAIQERNKAKESEELKLFNNYVQRKVEHYCSELNKALTNPAYDNDQWIELNITEDQYRPAIMANLLALLKERGYNASVSKNSENIINILLRD